MIFNSLTYLLLIFAVVPIYWIMPKRFKLCLIFTVSLTFYSFWRIEFLPVLLFSIAVDWLLAKNMKGRPKKTRFKLLIVSLSINLGLLFYFKYLIFFAENAIGLSNLLGFNPDPIFLNIVLPLGISFYTFQSISYVVDVYRKTIEPEPNFLLYSCYVSFFPQLVAGPVLRASEIIPQFKKPTQFKLEFVSVGVRRISYGLFLKVVLADNIAPFVDQGFSTPINTISALDVLTLAYLFGFQIYFDFCAYSHIAIGTARLLGITFPENFNFPYIASSPREFWRKWHISLSSWIRDYLYLPLSGIKFRDVSTEGINVLEKKKKSIKPLFISWAIMGLWHGANWTFLVWGLYHSTLIACYRGISPVKEKVPKFILRISGPFLTLPLIMLSWIPFRSSSLSETLSLWLKFFDPNAYSWLGLRENTYLVCAIILMLFFAAYIVKEHLSNYLMIRMTKTVAIIDSLSLAVIFFLLITFLRPINQFIYFQF